MCILHSLQKSKKLSSSHNNYGKKRLVKKYEYLPGIQELDDYSEVSLLLSRKVRKKRYAGLLCDTPSKVISEAPGLKNTKLKVFSDYGHFLNLTRAPHLKFNVCMTIKFSMEEERWPLIH